MDYDLAETRATGFEPFPQPRRHVLDGRVLQTLNIVQIRMIELFDERFHRRADASVVVEPAGHRVNFPLDRNLNLETVAMHSPAFVFRRDIRKRLRGFESEILCQTNSHNNGR
jgi:hypothetical protein